jgi:lipoprotein-releasing system permease protein
LRRRFRDSIAVPALMQTRLALFVGLRYAFGNRGQGYLSFVSVFSLIAMTLGVAILIVVLSVMNGFDREIKNRMLDVLPQATLSLPEGLADWASLRDAIAVETDMVATPYVEGQALLGFGRGLAPTVLYGLEPAALADRIAPHMLAGDLQALAPGEFGIVIGQLLARELGVVPGDKLLITLPELSITPAGAFPRVKRVTLVGAYRVGGQSDNGVAFLHLADAQKLFRRGDRVDGLRLTLPDPYRLEGVAALRERYPAYRVSTWQEEASDLFHALRMEKTVVGLLLSVIVGVAAFNIIAALVLMVNEKRSAIGVLRSYGASRGTIAAIFNVQGCALGLTGIALGAVLGGMLALQLADLIAWIEDLLGFRIFDPELYFITRLPSQLQWPDVVWVCAGASVLTLLATLYPAWRAGRLNPVETLQSAH